MSDSYRRILLDADAFFARVMEALPEQLECHRGCTMCCHGLFALSEADVSLVAHGMESLDPEARMRLEARASALMVSLEQPNLRECSPGERAEFFERAADTPCPALSDEGACEIYEFRPITCRTFGLPLSEDGIYLGQECELNFTTATEQQKHDSAWPLEKEDVVGPEDEFTVPEAILLGARLRG